MTTVSTNGELKEGIKRLLRAGKENARTGDWLAHQLGLNDDRPIRRAIREIIDDGLPVLSSVHPPFGYYIPDNPKDIQDHLQRLHHRAMEILGRHSALSLAAHKTYPPHQIALSM